MSHQPGEDPFQAAAERLGAKQGLSGEQFIEKSARQLEEYEYPTADCLLPEDILAFTQDEVLPEAPRAHASQCPFCSKLLQSLVPTSERVREFREMVSDAARAVPPPAHPGRDIGRENWSWAPAAAMASFLCAIGLVVMRTGSAPLLIEKAPKSVFDRVRVEEISKSAIFSQDAVSIQGGDIAITEDLRKLLANSATDAYLRTAMLRPARSRKKAFEQALGHELSHVASPEIIPDRQIVQYKGAQAVIDPTNLFDKIDARRGYTMSLQSR